MWLPGLQKQPEGQAEQLLRAPVAETPLKRNELPLELQAALRPAGRPEERPEQQIVKYPAEAWKEETPAGHCKEHVQTNTYNLCTIT